MSDIQHAAASAAGTAKNYSGNFLPCIFLVLLASALSACDGYSGSIGDLFKSPSAAEINFRVEQQASNGDIPAAIRSGETYLVKNTDFQGDLHRTLARLYNESGDAQNAVRHLQLSHGAPAVQSGIGTPSAASAAIAAPAPEPTSPAPPMAVMPVVEVDGASVRNTANGIEVRAGDAIATTPK